MSKFGWHYPAGSEHDPRAPYNQTEESPYEYLNDAHKAACSLFDLLDNIRDMAESDYKHFLVPRLGPGPLDAIHELLENLTEWINAIENGEDQE